MASFSFPTFLSFPNYTPTLRSSKIIRRGNYVRLEDVIRSLYELNFHDHHIREVYAAFHESGYLMHTLQSVRAVVIQIEPICCTMDKIHVLDNSAVARSERVMYIRMHDFVGGERRRCNDIQNAALLTLLGLFAILGIILSLRSMFEMIISS